VGVAAPRLLNLETIPGLLASGAVAGLLLSAVAIAVWVVARPGGGAAAESRAAAAEAAAIEASMASAAELRGRRLEFPVEGIPRERLADTFDEPRTGHVHEAADIMAPRNTPVRAVEAGTISRLLSNPSGGITIYQLDPSERFIYYYAHLERYAEGLREGLKVDRGQVIGYVGTSGNAPKGAPHLHFAIFRVVDPRQWWGGAPVNPYLVLR
jgi:murein DD-endopeptidase MepM/ murein hydrolase activator NlpD